MDEQWLRSIPKTELHLHLVGATSPETIIRLAQRHPDSSVPTDIDELRRFYEFTDFNRFIEVYQAVSALVTSGDDVAVLIEGLTDDLVSQGVAYAEITVTAATQLSDGIEPDELADALERGRRYAISRGLVIGWVYDIHGGLGLPVADITLDWVERFAPPNSVGFGLGGPEVGVPRSRFSWHFDRARDLGLVSVPHAGETTGPETVWSAVRDLKAARIGHGIASVHDPALLDHLAAQNITLEVCPTSNVCTGVVPEIADHPLRQLLDAGVPVTLSTDDPGMFGTDIIREYQVAVRVAELTQSEVLSIIRQGFDAALCDQATKTELQERVDAAIVDTSGERQQPGLD